VHWFARKSQVLLRFHFFRLPGWLQGNPNYLEAQICQLARALHDLRQTESEEACFVLETPKHYISVNTIPKV